MINTVRGLTNVDPVRRAAALLRRAGADGLPEAARPELRCRSSSRPCGWRRRWRRSARSSASTSRRRGQPRPVHRHAVRVPRLRAVVGGDHLRRRDRDRALLVVVVARAAREPVGAPRRLDLTDSLDILRRVARLAAERWTGSVNTVRSYEVSTCAIGATRCPPRRSSRSQREEEAACALDGVGRASPPARRAAASAAASPSAPAGEDADQAAAPVVPAGPVRGLLRRAGQGLLRRRGPRRHDPAGRGRHRSGDGRRGRQGPVRHLVGAAHARAARERRRRQVIGQVFQRSATPQVSFKDKNITAPSTQGQEDRQLGLRQRVRAARRHAQGRARPGEGRHDRPAAVRHERLRGRPDRCRAGDDLQRVRPGPRDEEPGDRPAVHAGRPQRHQVGAARHLDAPGRDLRVRGVAQGGQRGHRGQVPEGLVPGLDLLPRQRQPSASTSSSSTTPSCRRVTRPGS